MRGAFIGRFVIPHICAVRLSNKKAGSATLQSLLSLCYYYRASGIIYSIYWFSLGALPGS